MNEHEDKTPETQRVIELGCIIDDLLSLEDDGDSRFNALWHVYQIVVDGQIDDMTARSVLYKKGFSEQEIDDMFDGPGWEEV